MRLHFKEDPREWRKAALLGLIGPAVIAGILRWRGVVSTPVLASALAVIALAAPCAWGRPRWFRGYYRFTTRLGFYIIQVVGRVVLAVFFFSILTPFGWVLRLMGKDLLQLKAPRTSQRSGSRPDQMVRLTACFKFMSRRKPKEKPNQGSCPALSGRKLWCFRLLALAGVPLLFLLACWKLGLRLAGFGYPTGFLLKSSNRGEDTFVQNNQFGWRFFGPRAARLPDATSIPRLKPPGTVRIFVFGESAAYGDPQPRFGLPRMLEAMLSLRHPDKKFEVVNAAMTGINSHVIRPLARDCAKAGGDVWVIYMGNNEVVGPFGAGTVFGGQTPPLPLIRAGLASKRPGPANGSTR